MDDAVVDAGSLRWLQGVWRRDGRALAGRLMSEESQVVWAQAGDWFADVRQPHRDAEHLSHLDEAQAFSGVVRWEAGIMTWRHDLDTKLRTGCREDSAVVEVDGEDLIERGPGYEERWRRDEQAGAAAVFERRTPGGKLAARLVSVGDLSVTVWSGRRPGGAALRFAGGGWEVEACVGTGAIPWPAVLATRSGRVPAGWDRITLPVN